MTAGEPMAESAPGSKVLGRVWNQGTVPSVGNVREVDRSMRILWTFIKVIVGLAIAIPVSFFVLALAAGVLGALVGLAMFAVKLALIGLAGYGLYRVARHLFAPSPKP